jgi:hypothetical protein
LPGARASACCWCGTRAPPGPHRTSLEHHDEPALASRYPALPQAPASLERGRHGSPDTVSQARSSRARCPQHRSLSRSEGHRREQGCPRADRRTELEHVKPDSVRVGPRLDVSAAPDPRNWEPVPCLACPRTMAVSPRPMAVDAGRPILRQDR